MPDAIAERRGRGIRFLWAAAVAAVVALLTLTPRSIVAPARGRFMQLLDALGAPSLGGMISGDPEQVLNAILYLPLGGAIALLLGRRLWPCAILAAAALSALVEYTQITIPGRVPDPQDVVWNTVGAAIGVVVVTLARVAAAAIARGAQARQSDADLKPALGQRGQGEEAVVGPHDRRDDRQPQPGAVVVAGTARPPRPAYERLDQRRRHVGVQARAAVAHDQLPRARTPPPAPTRRRRCGAPRSGAGWPPAAPAGPHRRRPPPVPATSPDGCRGRRHPLAPPPRRRRQRRPDPPGSAPGPRRAARRASVSSASVEAIARSLVRADALQQHVHVAPVRIRLGDLDHRADDRVRRAQLVRGVRRETALLLDRALHARRASHRTCRRGRSARRAVRAAARADRGRRRGRARATAVIRSRGRSRMPASTHPPTSPNTTSSPIAQPA